MIEFALLVTALMFGGTVLYAFGFAAFLFTALPADTAGPLLRRAFPHFYLFVIATSAVAAGAVAFFDPLSAGILAAVAATAIYARQVLMPAINRATDEGEKTRFKRLHGFSVVITLAHIAAAAVVIVWIAGAT
ncbi:MAG: DUF4149 domain-containing protein [Pseudomonadota bacterium]